MLAIINISTAIVIIILAVLMKIFNLKNLVAGYNTLPKNKQKKYDEKLLLKYITNMMIISAVILIAGSIPSIFNIASAETYFAISWIIFTLFIISAVIFLNLNKKIKW
jgi:hypothetical protein